MTKYNPPNEHPDNGVGDALREVFESHASGVRAPHELAARARARADSTRSHRNRFAMVGAAALATAMIVVPAALHSADRTSPDIQATGPSTHVDTTSPTASVDATQAAQPGWQWVTYDHLELQVPASWNVNPQPCPDRDADPATGDVWRPHTDPRPHSCPAIPGDWMLQRVEFDSHSDHEDLPAGWLSETKTYGDQTVTVQTNDSALLDEIFASVQEVEGDDVVGCSTTADPFEGVDAYAGSSGAPAAPFTSGRVCEYRHPFGHDLLWASATLTGDQADAIARAYAAAPEGTLPVPPPLPQPNDWPCTGTVSRVVVQLESPSGELDLVLSLDCDVMSATDGTTVRGPTPELRDLIAVNGITTHHWPSQYEWG